MLFCVVEVKKIEEIIFIGDLFKITLDLSPRVIENCQSQSVLIIPPVEYLKRQSILQNHQKFPVLFFHSENNSEQKWRHYKESRNPRVRPVKKPTANGNKYSWAGTVELKPYGIWRPRKKFCKKLEYILFSDISLITVHRKWRRRYVSRGASSKSKNHLRPLVRPSSINTYI